MRSIVVLSFLSLDGVMQAPGGPDEDRSGGFAYGGWTAPLADEVSGQLMTEQLSQPFDLLLGRNTYERFAAYWPRQDAAALATVPFARATKYVVSRGSTVDLSWDRSVLVGGDVVAGIRALKEGDGPMLQVHGSGNLVQTLLANDLVDELWLKTFPVTLGQGKRLFGEGTRPAAFALTGSRTTPSGVVFATYARAGEVATGSFD
jgi:dihydrofolate reductase